MAESEIDRKIAVIFVADVVGYSKHMEKDENATFKAYGACEKILNKLLKKYKGSIFNTAGDSVLAEFPSAVNAVECAVDFQNEIKERNASDKTETKLEFRIGINMGDVVQKDGNLLGDGVNIAARLEALAQPNGITISKSVYDLVVPKTKVTFNDLGVQKVKQNTFHAYDILLDPSQKRTLKTQSSSNTTLFAGIAAALIIAIAGFFMFNGGEGRDKKIASSKPTILIYPFKIISSEENDKDFGLGMTENMISILSQYRTITVLSSSTSYQVKKVEMSNELISRDLGVNYVVRGTVQFMGSSARANVELTDLKLNKVSWSKQLDFKRDDIFETQDSLSQEVLKELQINVVTGSRQGTNWANEFKTMQDYTKFLNWREELTKVNKESHYRAQAILDELMETDLSDTFRYGIPGWQLMQKLLLGLSDDRGADMKQLKELIEKAGRDREVEEVLSLRAWAGLTVFKEPCENVLNYIDRAIQIGGSSDTVSGAATMYANCGNIDKAIEYSKAALVLTPTDIGWRRTSLLIGLLHAAGRTEEILALMKDNINSPDINGHILLYFAFLEHSKGNWEKAKSYLDRARQVGFSINYFKTIYSIKSENDELLQVLSKLGVEVDGT
ncbi:MAG: adenylate/guanylate cyclase domain-containing protein [Paracoccaceae bacterium]